MLREAQHPVESFAEAPDETTLENLLKRWLSVAESQMCALEVLCTQLPKVNALLETNMMDLSTSFTVLASQAQDQARNVAAVVAAAKQMQNDAGKAAAEQELARAQSVAEISAEKMIAAVSQAIIGMQFQDRVSQNLVIAQHVSLGIVGYLQTVLDETRACLKTDGEAVLDMAFAQRMAKYLTLGELQRQFIDHLVEHGYISDGSQLGFSGQDEGKSEQGDVELF